MFYLVQERIVHKNMNQSSCYNRKIAHCSMQVVYLNHFIKSKSGGVTTTYPSLKCGILASLEKKKKKICPQPFSTVAI